MEESFFKSISSGSIFLLKDSFSNIGIKISAEILFMSCKNLWYSSVSS
ncbi:MAG: hypothetical protein ACD_82C00082G0002 [uncultured bacterium]|nr:MAG: hypothetical protein ACD_82C00082G0002 [uncultured bacterium]